MVLPGFFGFWNALLFLTNSARASIPAFVEERCWLVVRGSFIDYVPVFLVCLAFEHYLLAYLEFSAT